MVVSAANSAARKRLRTSGQQPRAVEQQAAEEPDRPAGPALRSTGERADADVSLAAVGTEVPGDNAPDPGDADPDGALDPVDLDDEEPEFDDQDLDDADIQAALAEGDLDEPDLADVGAEDDLPEDELPEDELREDDLAGDDAEGPDGLEGAEPGAAAGPAAEASRPREPFAQVVKLAPDGGEDEEILVFGDDDEDLPAAQVAVAGATADPVKDYLKQIGKVPLLNAEQEVELAKRIEAGLFAEEKLAEGRG